MRQKPTTQNGTVYTPIIPSLSRNQGEPPQSSAAIIHPTEQKSPHPPQNVTAQTPIIPSLPRNQGEPPHSGAAITIHTERQSLCAHHSELVEESGRPAAGQCGNNHHTERQSQTPIIPSLPRNPGEPPQSSATITNSHINSQHPHNYTTSFKRLQSFSVYGRIMSGGEQWTVPTVVVIVRFAHGSFAAREYARC